VWKRETDATREAPSRGQAQDQPDAREGQAGRGGVAERPVVPLKSGNADGGKGPQFKTNARSGKGQEIGATLYTPESSETVESVTCRSEGRTRVLNTCSGNWRRQQVMGSISMLVAATSVVVQGSWQGGGVTPISAQQTAGAGQFAGKQNP